MSVAAMAWAWKRPNLNSTQQLVLLALADHINVDGFCWPRQEILAKKTRLKRPTINRIIKEMAEMGILEIIPRRDEFNRPRSNHYRFVGFSEGNVTDDDTSNVSNDDSTVTHADTESSRETSKKEPSDQSGESDDLTPTDLMEAWNEQVVPLGLPRVTELSETRRRKSAARIREHPLSAFWTDVLHNIKRSKFLCGLGNGRNGHENWRANFDWLIENETNVLKVYEGRYA